MKLDVTLLSPQEVLFEGKAERVTVPGEAGVFEVQPFHKRIISRLVSGELSVDEQVFAIKRGAIKVSQNKVVILIEEEA